MSLFISCQKEIPTPSQELAATNKVTTTTESALDYYSCGDKLETPQRTSNNLIAGLTTITNNFAYIEVTIETTGNWILDKTRIYIGTSSGVPLNSNGTPKINDFPYKTSHPWDTQVYKLRIPKGSLTGNITIVVQADVLRVNKTTCAIYECRSSYADGVAFVSGNVAQKVNYAIRPCIEI
tara:strand:+ start:12535 stop:13074 length:540 start_codon:yes stop_codon:yes gene_type:complete